MDSNFVNLPSSYYVKLHVFNLLKYGYSTQDKKAFLEDMARSWDLAVQEGLKATERGLNCLSCDPGSSGEDACKECSSSQEHLAFCNGHCKRCYKK